MTKKLNREIKKAITLVEKEKKWILLEKSFISKLEKAIMAKDKKNSQKYSQACSRVLKREHRFLEHLKTIFRYMQSSYCRFSKFLEPLGKELNIYESILVKKISNPAFGEKGEIPSFLKAEPIPWKSLLNSVQEINRKEIAPLVAVINSIEKKLKENELKSPYVRRKNSYFDESVVEIVENYMEGVFTKTYLPEKKMMDGVLRALKDRPNIYGHAKTGHGEIIVIIATLCNGLQMIKPKNAIKTIGDILKGKCFLSIGDDSGSLTEVLKHFGGITLGIEYDKGSVEIAHKGLLSEDGTPRTDVLQGDMFDLFIPNQSLAKIVKQYKYDIIITNNLFTGGVIDSGLYFGNLKKLFREEYENTGVQLHEGMPDRTVFFVDQIHSFLKKGGFQIHYGISDDILYNMQLLGITEIGVFPQARVGQGDCLFIKKN